jgi:hypothetical protein
MTFLALVFAGTIIGVADGGPMQSPPPRLGKKLRLPAGT